MAFQTAKFTQDKLRYYCIIPKCVAEYEGRLTHKFAGYIEMVFVQNILIFT